MCYEALNVLETGGNENGKQKFAQKKLSTEPLFRKVMDLFRDRKRASNGGLMIHPKMYRLRALLLQYFADQQPSDGAVVAQGDAPSKESKVMVFASFRRAVEQIVDQLNLDAPLIRAHRFIGQAASKEGLKGLSQKEQLKVIDSNHTSNDHPMLTSVLSGHRRL